MKEIVKKDNVTFRYIGKSGAHSYYTVARNVDDQIVGDILFDPLNNQYVLGKTFTPITAATLKIISLFIAELNDELVEAQ